MNAPAGGRLHGTRIALLVEDGFSRRQLEGTREALAAGGADVILVAPSTRIAYRDRTGELEVAADLDVAAARRETFDAVIVPGGHAPDRLRMRPPVIDLITDTLAAGRCVAAICHGPQVLISAQVLRGRTVTCWPSIAIDVKNAGGLYVDRPCVRDSAIVTARKSDDLPQFVAAIVEAVTSRR